MTPDRYKYSFVLCFSAEIEVQSVEVAIDTVDIKKKMKIVLLLVV